MAHSRLGDADAARTAYDEGCAWMERTRTTEASTQELRWEAADLLGIERRSR
jgi:hypothetical protein